MCNNSLKLFFMYIFKNFLINSFKLFIKIAGQIQFVAN